MPKMNETERRVVGTLIEKWLTTPQGYPLSLNSLMNGCNQKSAREPLSEYTEQEIEQCCTALKVKGFAIQFFGAGARVPKWEEALSAVLNLSKEESAVVAELLLRGPQSEGELRARASRMAEIPTLEVLHATLEKLRTRPEPLVQRLSEQGRTRGVRWAHTFYAEGEAPPAESPTAFASGNFSASPTATAGISPLQALQGKVAELEARIAELESRTRGL